MLNYPLYFTIKDVFCYGKSMYQIRTTIDNENKIFKDVNALGLFVDNHDNNRFLNVKPSHTLFKSALAFITFTQGIPIIYYGSEQGYAGGSDPANRETLWTDFKTDSELYQFISAINSVRKSH
jgi:alpha-amylase